MKLVIWIGYVEYGINVKFLLDSLIEWVYSPFKQSLSFTGLFVCKYVSLLCPEIFLKLGGMLYIANYEGVTSHSPVQGDGSLTSILLLMSPNTFYPCNLLFHYSTKTARHIQNR